MSSFEWNKIIGSILTAVLIAQVAAILGSMLVKPRELEKPVFSVPIATETASAQAPKAAGPPPIGLRLAKADPKKGEQEAQVCTACHTFKKGQPNAIGPNLWNVANSEMGEDRNGFDFSSAMEAKKGTKWTPALLDKWLTDPQAMIPGTKMTFAGIPDPQHRANVIAFLETLTPGGLAAEKKLAEKLAAETPKPAAAQPAKPTGPTFAALFAKADPKKGKEQAQVCTACHTFEKGQPNAIGPNLWNIVGSPRGEDRNGYDFSSAMEAKKGPKWTPELLNKWLTNPQAFIPGTKMTFAGFPSEKERANVIAFLATLSPGGLAAEQELAKKLAAEAPKPAAPAAKPAKPTGPSFAALLAKADAKKGQEDAQICSACHTFTKGGPNAIGPNLWGVVGSPMGEDHQGYDFSAAVEKKKGTKLTPEVLNVWLTDPQKFAPGTKMTFAGFPSEKERADVIKYLQTLK